MDRWLVESMKKVEMCRVEYVGGSPTVFCYAAAPLSNLPTCPMWFCERQMKITRYNVGRGSAPTWGSAWVAATTTSPRRWATDGFGMSRRPEDGGMLLICVPPEP